MPNEIQVNPFMLSDKRCTQINDLGIESWKAIISEILKVYTEKWGKKIKI